MREILILGKVEKEDVIWCQVESGAAYRLHQTMQLRKARQFIRKNEPEFILVTGHIEMNKDGSYFIQL